MAMKLSTGKVAFPIEFDNGDKDCIYFNPNDPDLAARLIASKDKIEKRMNELNADNLSLSNDGETLIPDDLNIEKMTEEQLNAVLKNAEEIKKIITDTKNIVYEELNTAFGSDVSSVVFKHCSPFAIVDGNYFILNFLEAITPEIKKHVQSSNIEAEKRMNKHLNKYLR